MELVGRSTEMDAIARAVEEARDGGTPALAIVGEPGIGKSALLGAAATVAGKAGVLVLAGRAAEHEREVPFGLVIDAFDDHVSTLHPSRIESVGPELGAVLPAAAEVGTSPLASGPAERFRHHRALRSLIELLGRERPLALVLDDLQWADEASVELVLHLLRRPPRVGFLLALGTRPSPQAQRVLDAGRRSAGWTELRPQLLERDAASSLLPAELAPSRREQVLEAAAGNPLFLQELARSGAADAEALPETLTAAVLEELEPLGAGARALAEGAAIAGDPFDLDVAAAAGGVDEAEVAAALDDLVAAGLVRGGDGRQDFRFRHPLVHRAAADTVPPGRRLEAHERAARALAAAGASPTLQARHLAEFARPGDQVAIGLLTAAARAAHDAAPATAARWYAAALRLLPHDAAEQRALLLTPMAAALASAGDLAASRDTITEAIALLGPRQAEERAELISTAATVEVLLGAFDAAESRLRAALEDSPAAQRSRLLLQRGGIAFFRGDAEGVLNWTRRAEEELGEDGPPALRAAALAQRGFGMALKGDPGADLLLDAAALLGEVDDAELARNIEAAWTVGGNLGQVERFAEAVAVLERGLRLARESHQEHLLQHLHVLLAMFQLPLLRLDDAIEHANAAEEIARLQERSYDLGFALSVRARILAARGDAVEAERAAVESDELLGDSAAPVTLSSLSHNAVVRLGSDPERLLEELELIAGAKVERLNRFARAAPATAATRANVALDRLDEGERFAEAAAGAIAEGEPPVSALRARRAEAEVLLARGAAAEAAALATTIAEEAGAIGARQEELAARQLQARSLLAADRREQAIEVLQQLATDAAEATAFADRDAAARELRRAGARVSIRAQRTPSQDDQLTPREREIAELVANGHSNKQVAAELFISEKTVERHLSTIYARLQIRSRVELPRALTKR